MIKCVSLSYLSYSVYNPGVVQSSGKGPGGPVEYGIATTLDILGFH